MIKNIFKYNFSTLLMVDLKKLRDIIQELEKIHQLYILNLIITRSVPYSENSNGVFINMSVIATESTYGNTELFKICRITRKST